MADWASTSYVIEGPKDTLQSIYNAIIKTKNNEEGYKWEPDVLDSLGIIWEDVKNRYNESVYLRGGILPDSIIFDGDTSTLSFSAEEAYGVSDLKDVLTASYQGLKIYYVTEEPNEEVYATNDKRGKYFPYRFYVDTCIDGNYQQEYFVYKSDVFKWLHKITNGKVNTEEKVEEFNEEYETNDSWDENYISIHEFVVIEE